MSEVVYVIRLKKDKDQNGGGESANYGFNPLNDYQISHHGLASSCHQDIVLPSEQR